MRHQLPPVAIFEAEVTGSPPRGQEATLRAGCSADSGRLRLENRASFCAISHKPAAQEG
jgi:hypothetical protein